MPIVLISYGSWILPILKRQVAKFIPHLLLICLFALSFAETVNGLYESKVIEYLKKDWIGINDVELATFEWVD